MVSRMSERPTLAVGLMSGTSLDGVDAALGRLDGPTHATLLDFVTRPYTDAERKEIPGLAFNGATAPSSGSSPRAGSGSAAEAVQTVLVQGQGCGRLISR